MTMTEQTKQNRAIAGGLGSILSSARQL